MKLFYERADEVLRKKIVPQFIEKHLLPYWNRKTGKRFTRKFWENPDANDPDNTAAFRKRSEQTKMTLRKNEVSINQKIARKRQMKDETVNHVVAKLLPDVWKREATK